MNIEYFDTTLRDGAQSLPEANQFEQGAKSFTADHIAALGVSTIEAGFPATPHDGEEVHEVARTVGNTIYTVEPTHVRKGQLVVGSAVAHTPIVTGLSRSVEADIEKTWAAVTPAKKPGIHVFVSTDDDHMRAKHPNMTPDQVVAMATSAVAFANEVSEGAARVEFSAEAASTTDPAFLDRVVAEVLQRGARVINLPDTVGQSRPIAMERMFFAAASRVIAEGMAGEVTLSTHNHNDSGMALINSMAAAQGVQRAYAELGIEAPRSFQIEGVVGGLGERAGNTAIEQAIHYVNAFGQDESMHQVVDTRKVLATARAVFGAAGLAIPRQAPIIGADILAHRSGIHSDGIIKGGASMYSPFDPRWFGHDSAGVIEDGKYQGRRGARAVGAVDQY